MGCRLPKPRKTEERRSPGNIYSTLRRPQVETKVGVAYTYHFLDFLLGKEEVSVSSVLRLSSVRELPVQVRELYAQGFVLVAVHPFVHPCGPRHAHIQRQLHRAVLVQETASSESGPLRRGRPRLETDVCVAGRQSADPEVIQSYVKRIQDVAEQGVMFVGFLRQPGGAPCFLGHCDPDELSSLHSSPSPIRRHPPSANTSPTDATEPRDSDTEHGRHRSERREWDREPNEASAKAIQSLDPDHGGSCETIQTLQLDLRESLESATRTDERSRHTSGHAVQAQGSQRRPSPSEASEVIGQRRNELPDLKPSPESQCSLSKRRERRSSSSDSWLSSPELHTRKSSATRTDGGVTAPNNNNHIRLKGPEREDHPSPPNLSAQARMQLFALYNHTGEANTSPRFCSLRVPLRVQKEAGLVTEVDTQWLDHMTHLFASGARLIDGFFHLEDDNHNGVSSVDSVFIFQSSAEETANTSYDAIVVEQWTVVDGVVVKADYIPLLQSLAPYGWRLMCVLPTPIVKTNSDGSLSTKQILFLQRPILQRKRKDFKFQMLNRRGRSKAKKKSTGGIPVNFESPVLETQMDGLRRITEAEGGRIWDSGGSKGASPQRAVEETEEDAGHPKAFTLVSEDEREEETDVDATPRPEQRPARCTDVSQGDGGGGGVKEEVKVEERIKRQLFSGVC